MLKLSRYQWTVFVAAWLGWGFDVFDGLLFNFVAPNAIPTLLGVPIGGPEARGLDLRRATNPKPPKLPDRIDQDR